MIQKTKFLEFYNHLEKTSKMEKHIECLKKVNFRRIVPILVNDHGN